MNISRLVYSPPVPTHFSSRHGVSPPSLIFFPNPNPQTPNRLSLSVSTVAKATSPSDSDLHVDDNDDDLELEAEGGSDVVDVEIVKLEKNSRRISCGVGVDADLETVWGLLTDYENLADFIPGLAVCQLLERVDNRARLFQVGQQNLAFGIKFNAKGTVDCYEKDLEKIPFGQRRDIDFEMIEGDFQVFKGKWSIEEVNDKRTSVEQEFQTTLSYVVEVKPKLWLPVHLIEGRLCREIKQNLLCIKEQAQKTVYNKLHTS